MAATLIVLSLTASLNPTLVAITSLLLLRDSPAEMMVGFLAGALTISVSLGIAIVLAFDDAHPTARTTQHAINPAVDVALGALLLLVAVMLHSDAYGRRADRRHELRQAKHAHKGPSRWERALNRGTARTAFVLGMLFTLPGASYIAGLAEIHRLHTSTVGVVLLVLGFNLVMLWIIELPLVGFLVAPTATPIALDRAKAWVSVHARQLAVNGSATIGTLLVIKGVIGLLA
jgi:Sap, sulfolipid-1-addressing protein